MPGFSYEFQSHFDALTQRPKFFRVDLLGEKDSDFLEITINGPFLDSSLFADLICIQSTEVHSENGSLPFLDLPAARHFVTLFGIFEYETNLNYNVQKCTLIGWELGRL